MSSQLQDIVNARNGGYSAATEYENAEAWAKKYADATTAKYAAGIQNLTDQKARLSTEYDPYRAAANAQYERNVRTNKEQMANLGLNRSGANITNQVKLSTERQRNIAQVNSDQAKAEQEIRAQINEYIAQRDSQIMEQYAKAYETAANNVSSFQRSSALAEQQFGYDQKLAELDYTHDKEMAALNHQYAIAEMNNDYAKKAQLEREMAALDYSYSMQKIERQSQLDNESYAQKAATDWDYYQKQAALDNQNELSLYNSKAATDWSYYQKQSALDNSYSSKSTSSNSTSSYLAKMPIEEIESSLEVMGNQNDMDSIAAFLDDLTAAGRLSEAQANTYYADYMLKNQGKFYNNRHLSNTYDSYYEYAYGSK